MKRNKYTYIWVSLVILVFGIIFVPKIVDRVQRGAVVESDRMNRTTAEDPLAYVTLNGKRKKVPPFEFLNQDSLLITDRDFLGKVYVVDFFFTRCPSICPVMTKNLVSIQNEFGERPDFGIASFTITPQTDTPRVLKEYAEAKGITDIDWHLLTGDRERIHNLANMGFNIFAAEMPDAPGGFEHSGLFALIDKEGYIRSRLDAFGNPIVYYQGAVDEENGTGDEGEEEQISLLKEDIQKLLEE